LFFFSVDMVTESGPKGFGSVAILHAGLSITQRHLQKDTCFKAVQWSQPALKSTTVAQK